jgi:hypothetical protein
MARDLGPTAELAQKVVRSNEIAGGKLALVGFVNAADDDLVGHLLVEQSPDHFEHVSFPSCDGEGGPPELMAVFFARTVKGGARDLAVLCGWPANGQAQNGRLYAAEFYRVDAAGSKIAVTTLKDLSGKFNTADMLENKGHGKWVRTGKARFKTVADVKRLLTKMGLPQ